MKVLSKNRVLLAYVGLSIDDYVQIFGRSIPCKLFQLAFSMALILGLLMPGLLVLTNLKFKPLVATLIALNIWLTFISSALGYISLLAKAEQIAHLYDYVQNVVDQSK